MAKKKANGILGSIMKSIPSRSKKEPAPLLSPGDTTSRVLCPVLDFLEIWREIWSSWGWSSRELQKGLEHLSYEERLRELGLLSL